MSTCLFCKAESNLYTTPGTERTICFNCLHQLIEDTCNLKTNDTSALVQHYQNLLEENQKLRNILCGSYMYNR
jgi:hypothetical protein